MHSPTEPSYDHGWVFGTSRSRTRKRCALIRSPNHLYSPSMTQSIEIQPSVIGYIAKSVALVESGQKEDGCRVLDLAFRYCNSVHVDHLLLIKVCIRCPSWLGCLIMNYHIQAVVLSMAGKHVDAVLRVDDLIATAHQHSEYYVVQARA